MQLNNPYTLGFLDPANKECFCKSKKGSKWAIYIPAKTSKTIWKVMNKLIIKGVILVLDWTLKYVVLTNLGIKWS